MSFQNCKIVSVNADPAVYHDAKGIRGLMGYPVSSSTLREIVRCARRWKRGYVAPDTEPKKWGNLFECLLLQPQYFAKHYAVRPEKYSVRVMRCPKCKSETKAAKCRECGCERLAVMVEKDWNSLAEHCQDWKAKIEESGMEIIRADWRGAADIAVEVFRDDPQFKSFIEASDPQVWVKGEWADKATGIVVPTQCLLDLVPRKDTEFAKTLADVKTSKNAGYRAFSSWAYNAGYHHQAAWDTDMYVAATGDDRCSWAWLIQENYEPYECGKRIAEQDLVDLGRQEYQWAISQYCRRVAEGKWPGYDEALPEKDTVQGWGIMRAEQWMREKSFALMYGELRETEPIFASSPDDVGPAAPPDDEIVP
jgi:hypothetical protein